MINYINNHKLNFIITILIIPHLYNTCSDYSIENNTSLSETYIVGTIILIIIFFSIEGLKRSIKQ